MNLKTYDFRKPERPAGTLEQRLTVWLEAACQLAAECWPQHLPFRVETGLRAVERLPPAEALARLADACVSYRVGLAGGEPTTLFIWPRPLALALVSAALGEEAAAESVADRDLSVVELSLCEYLMQNVLAAVLQETWPGATPLPVAVGSREPSPRWTRLFVLAEHVLLCTFTLAGPFGEHSWSWLLPVQGLLERFTRTGAGPERSPAAVENKLEAVVRELPVEVTVDLGSVELPISQLAGLAAGDLLILNQRVAEPLTARVDGQKKFRGWAGRVGSRQGLQIASLIG